MPDTFDDKYLNKGIVMARGASNEDQLQHGNKVTKRMRDAEGRLIGTANENPLLDTREYAVKFRDGHSESLSANLLEQFLYSQVDEEGNVHVLLDDIIDHRRGNRAVDKEDAFHHHEKRSKAETRNDSGMGHVVSMERWQHQLGGA